MSITKLHGNKSELNLQEKYDCALEELNLMRERLADIWWLLTDVRDNYKSDIGPRSYVNAAIALAEPFVDHEE